MCGNTHHACHVSSLFQNCLERAKGSSENTEPVNLNPPETQVGTRSKPSGIEMWPKCMEMKPKFKASCMYSSICSCAQFGSQTSMAGLSGVCLNHELVCYMLQFGSILHVTTPYPSPDYVVLGHFSHGPRNSVTSLTRQLPVVNQARAFKQCRHVFRVFFWSSIAISH